jgi:hypothetical protein
MNIESILNPGTVSGESKNLYEDTTPNVTLSSTSSAKTTEIPLGVYSDLTWNSKEPAEEIADSESFGTKTLPGAGAFYFANHEDGNPTMGHLESAQHDD